MGKIVKILFAGCIICILLNCKVYGQQHHFIYIQVDEKQLFSVQVNNKTYNSSDIGYVIIPKLTDGKYQLNVSFPNNKFPDQQFSCVINKADAGYALKNYGDKGWGLFNFQSLELTMAGNNAAVAEAKSDTINPQADTTIPNDTAKANAFGEMLSQVVNDTSLKVTPSEQSTNKQQTIPANEANKQPVGIVAAPAFLNDSLKNAQSQMPATDTFVILNKSMRKIDEQQTDEGVNMVFVDPASGNDTVKIFVPSPKEKIEDSAVAKNETSDLSVDTIQSVHEIPDTSSTSQSQVNNPFYSGKQTKDTVSKTAVENNLAENKPGDASQMAYKSGCAKMLSDNDLDKLKKKISSGNSVDKMIQTAKKYFQDKCLTTEQVKSLGALFLSDDARYSFFDVAYPNVYDISAFASLENQLVDPYYKKRFRAMLR
jgi:Domain of unknown function (DUF4476)